MITSPGSSAGQRLKRSFFFALFFLAGCGFFYAIALRPVIESRRARVWIETPCVILSSAVKAHHDSDGSSYSVEISYRYQVEGKTYQSDRYQLIRFSSSGRKAKEAAVARYRKGSHATCYVNPQNPSEAVLDRTAWVAGWWSLFPLLFVGIGGAGIVSALWGKGKEAGNEAAQPDEEPWRRRPDWVAGCIESEQKGLVFLTIFTVIWNAISMPIVWTALQHHPLEHGHYAQLFVLLFPLIGLVLIVAVAISWVRWLRFGKSYFDMEAVPGAVGGILKGTIRLTRPISPTAPVSVELQCLSRMLQRNGDSNSTRETELWTDEQLVTVGPGCLEIPVALRIPADARPTTSIGMEEGVFWRVEAWATLPGVDYKARWEVPVYEAGLLPGEGEDAPAQDGVTGR